MRDQVSLAPFFQGVQSLTRADEATVRDRERLVKEYGVRSIIDLRTKYARQIRSKTRRPTEAGPNTSNKLRSEMPKSRHQLQFLSLTTTLLDH